jgi:hypothetical protein
MQKGLLFWVLMLLWLVVGLWAYWPAGGGTAVTYGPVGVNLILFVLIAILGWKAFGPPVQG